MFDLLDSNPEFFYLLWLGTLAFTLIVFFIGGRNAEKKFRDLKQQTIRFRERGASGRSHRSLATKLGGASRALDVIVTDRELWIKGIWPAFTFIAARFDLSHRVPLERVGSTRQDGRSVFVTVRDELDGESVLELQLKKPDEFLLATGSR